MLHKGALKIAEKKAKEISDYREVARRERIRYLADLMMGRKKAEKNPPEIYREELEKSVEAVIEQEAIALYQKVTGKKKIPEEGVPQEYWDRAMMEVLKRWQKTLKDIHETVPKTAMPPEAEHLVGAPPVCPKHGVPMKRLIGGLWQCPVGYEVVRMPA